MEISKSFQHYLLVLSWISRVGTTIILEAFVEHVFIEPGLEASDGKKLVREKGFLCLGNSLSSVFLAG